MKAYIGLLIGALATSVCGIPTDLFDKLSGSLDADFIEKFKAVKRDHKNAERMLHEYQKWNVEFPRHVEEEKKKKKRGLLPPKVHLPFGGGIVDGIMQPFTGPLSGILVPTPQPQGLKKIPGNDPLHQFKRPGKGDVRGMCPFMNTLANHGYISRNGITTFAEAANAVQTGYGFDFPLSVFLSAVGLLAGGDLLSGLYSIGGADKRVPNTLGPAQGLDSHGVFEIDGSMTRQDVQFGNNANFIMQRWREYVAITKKYANQFGFATNAEDNGYRYDISRKTNPNFFAGVIWFVVSHAARVFVYEGAPNGTDFSNANYANVAPFYLDERFPENWFRRGKAFSLPGAFAQAGKMFLANPRELGANMGSTDNFVPLSPKLGLSTPEDIICFGIKNFFDLNPKQLTNGAYEHFKLFDAFAKGSFLPFFNDVDTFNCNITAFTTPSASAGQKPDGSYSSVGSPHNGKYPGIGYIKPDSQPS